MLNKLRALAKLIVTRLRGKARWSERDATSCFEVLFSCILPSLFLLSYLQLHSLDDFICFFFDTPLLLHLYYHLSLTYPLTSVH
jgi:hypothetical protein